MQRVCFTLTIDPDHVAEYRERHREVWPEMRDALHDAGWANYSIFVHDDGRVIGYVEVDDFDAARERMAGLDVNRRWQAEMQRFFTGIAGQAPDMAMRAIPEAFHLD